MHTLSFRIFSQLQKDVKSTCKSSQRKYVDRQKYTYIYTRIEYDKRKEKKNIAQQ